LKPDFRTDIGTHPCGSDTKWYTRTGPKFVSITIHIPLVLF